MIASLRRLLIPSLTLLAVALVTGQIVQRQPAGPATRTLIAAVHAACPTL